MERSGWTFRTTERGDHQRIWRVVEPDLAIAEELVRIALPSATKIEALDPIDYATVTRIGLSLGQIQEWS